MRIVSKQGVVVEFHSELGLLLNGKPPLSVTRNGDYYKATCIFVRVVRPNKARGQRKRKKALMSAVRRFRFSFNFQQET